MFVSGHEEAMGFGVQAHGFRTGNGGQRVNKRVVVSGILVIMLWIPGIRLSVFAIPFWVGFLWLCFLLRARVGAAST